MNILEKDNTEKFFWVCLIIFILSLFFVPYYFLSTFLFATIVSFIASRLPKNKLYKWQRIILWIVVIFYFIMIYYFDKLDYIRDGRSYWITALDSFGGFMIIFPVLLLLFKAGNWIYLKNKK